MTTKAEAPKVGEIIVYKWGEQERSGRVVQVLPSGDLYVRQNGLDTTEPGWGEVFHVAAANIVTATITAHKSALAAQFAA